MNIGKKFYISKAQVKALEKLSSRKLSESELVRHAIYQVYKVK